MQRRRHSIAEAVINTALGFVLSNLVWPLIQLYVLRQPYRLSQGLEVIGAFTVLSVARNYWVRRMFNRAAAGIPDTVPGFVIKPIVWNGKRIPKGPLR